MGKKKNFRVRYFQANFLQNSYSTELAGSCIKLDVKQPQAEVPSN